MDLKPQEPAEGILKISDASDFKQYHVECNCGNSDDAIDFIVSETHGEVVVETYTTQKTPWWEDPFRQRKSYEIENEFLYQLNYYVRGFLNATAHRLRITWDVWIHGYVKYSQSTIMTTQQALNYSNTLRQAVENVVAEQERRRQERENATK